MALRFFTVYGPRGRPDMAAFKFIDKIHNDTPIDKYGDGSMVREFTYVPSLFVLNVYTFFLYKWFYVAFTRGTLMILSTV